MRNVKQDSCLDLRVINVSLQDGKIRWDWVVKVCFKSQQEFYFILEAIGSQCSLWSRGVSCLYLQLRKISLATVWRIDCHGERLEEGRPF